MPSDVMLPEETGAIERLIDRLGGGGGWAWNMLTPARAEHASLVAALREARADLKCMREKFNVHGPWLDCGPDAKAVVCWRCGMHQSGANEWPCAPVPGWTPPQTVMNVDAFERERKAREEAERAYVWLKHRVCGTEKELAAALARAQKAEKEAEEVRDAHARQSGLAAREVQRLTDRVCVLQREAHNRNTACRVTLDHVRSLVSIEPEPRNPPAPDVQASLARLETVERELAEARRELDTAQTALRSALEADPDAPVLAEWRRRALEAESREAELRRLTTRAEAAESALAAEQQRGSAICQDWAEKLDAAEAREAELRAKVERALEVDLRNRRHAAYLRALLPPPDPGQGICGDQIDDYVCNLPKGHDGRHVAVVPSTGQGAASWARDPVVPGPEAAR